MSRSGVAHFQLIGKLFRGTYELKIDNVALSDHTFNPTGGVTSGSVYIK